MIISLGYLLARCLLGGLMVLARREVSKDAELLVLRHENAVLRLWVPKTCATWAGALRMAVGLVKPPALAGQALVRPEVR